MVVETFRVCETLKVWVTLENRPSEVLPVNESDWDTTLAGGFPSYALTDLADSDEGSRILLAMSPDGISVVDTTGRILTCNEQFAHMHGFGYSAEVIGRNAAEFARPEEFACLYRGVAAAFASGADVARDIECEVLRRDGTAFTAEYSVAQVPWPDAPTGVAFISNIRDVTRRKELLTELECHRTKLEDLVQERTRELQAEIAESTAVQTASQRSERILAEAERIAHLGSWQIDLAADTLWLSDEMKRIFGFDRMARPATRADISNAIHPEDRSAVYAAMAHAMQPDQVYSVQYRIVLPEGETRVIHVQGEVLRDAAGQPTHIRGMVQDITEQERVKDALGQRVSELSNLQALSAAVSLSLPWEEVAQIYLQRIVTLADLDMAQVFLLKEDRLDLAGVHARKGVQVIPQTECVVGECLCGLAVTERRPLYAGDAQSEARCTREECRAGVLHSLLASPLRSGDAVFGVLTLGARARDAFAGKLAFLETAVDQIAVRLQNALLHREIRERAAGLAEIVAERTLELQTERDRTQTILETVGESVIVTDLDGLVLFSNPATEALTGFSRDETLGQSIWRGWSAQALKDAWPQAQKALRGGQPWQGEVTGCRKDGAPYIAVLTGTPLYEERVATLAMGGVWVQRDITAVKEVGRLRDQFVSNVSHELRTPISIIALSCDNLDRLL